MPLIVMWMQAARQPPEYHALFKCMIDPDARENLSKDCGCCRMSAGSAAKIRLDVEGLAHLHRAA